MKLHKFLVEAKKATYAGNGNEKKLLDGCRELVYEEGNLKYVDKYYGWKFFSGQEIVFNKEIPIWSMNYYGGSFKTTLFTKKIYNFLKKALSEVNEDFPFRGPKEFSEKNWGYKNDLKGNLNNFKGREEIFYKKELVYELEYHGGEIKR